MEDLTRRLGRIPPGRRPGPARRAGRVLRPARCGRAQRDRLHHPRIGPDAHAPGGPARLGPAAPGGGAGRGRGRRGRTQRRRRAPGRRGRRPGRTVPAHGQGHLAALLRPGGGRRPRPAGTCWPAVPRGCSCAPRPCSGAAPSSWPVSAGAWPAPWAIPAFTELVEQPAPALPSLKIRNLTATYPIIQGGHGHRRVLGPPGRQRGPASGCVGIVSAIGHRLPLPRPGPHPGRAPGPAREPAERRGPAAGSSRTPWPRLPAADRWVSTSCAPSTNTSGWYGRPWPPAHSW